MIANSSDRGEVYLVVKMTEERLNEFRTINKVFNCNDDEAFNKLMEASKSILWDKSSTDRMTEDGRKLYTIKDAHKFIGMQNFHPGVVYITYLTEEGSKETTGFTTCSYKELEKEWDRYSSRVPNVRKDAILGFDIDLMSDDKKIRRKMFESVAKFLGDILAKNPSSLNKSGIAEMALAGMLNQMDGHHEGFFESVLHSVGQVIDNYPSISTELRYHGIGLPNITSIEIEGEDNEIKVVSDKLK